MGWIAPSLAHLSHTWHVFCVFIDVFCFKLAQTLRFNFYFFSFASHRFSFSFFNNFFFISKSHTFMQFNPHIRATTKLLLESGSTKCFELKRFFAHWVENSESLLICFSFAFWSARHLLPLFQSTSSSFYYILYFFLYFVLCFCWVFRLHSDMPNAHTSTQRVWRR